MEKEQLTEKYELFGRLMTEDKVYQDPSLGYRALCRMIGIKPRMLDRLLMKELGVKGKDLFGIYRRESGPPSSSC